MFQVLDPPNKRTRRVLAAIPTTSGSKPAELSSITTNEGRAATVRRGTLDSGTVSNHEVPMNNSKLKPQTCWLRHRWATDEGESLVKSILITGAGRGIGRATALRLAGNGWKVFAGVRDSAVGDDLIQKSRGLIVPIMLDVTSAEDIEELKSVLPDQLSAVLNNAGNVVDGPVESLTAESLRRQFEVNVIGAQQVTRAVLPRIRRAQGRILFVSSVSGRVSTPWMGAYCASKYALESIADSLRMELRPWSIHVSVIEPAATATDLWSEASSMVDTTVAAFNEDVAMLYCGHIPGIRQGMKLMQRQAVPINDVSTTIERALNARRPKARYPVGLKARLAIVSSFVTPTFLTDHVVASAMGIPRTPPAETKGT